MGFRASQREVGSQEARSYAENTRALDQSTLCTTELELRYQYLCRELHLTPCDWQQYLQMEQRAEDWYALLNGVLVSRVRIAGHDDHRGLIKALHELESRIRTRRGLVQAHGVPSVMVRSAREGARLAARRKVV